MRFMIMVKADKNSEAGVLPDEKLLTEMGKFNEELVKAGVMLAGEGLHPSSKGARVRFSGDKRTVIDGPFAETKELIAGYWLWQVKSKEEAIEWVKRCPNPTGAESRDRNPPGVRGGGFRRRVHARAPGAGRAAARADRGQAVAGRQCQLPVSSCRTGDWPPAAFWSCQLCFKLAPASMSNSAAQSRTYVSY